jgi:hypothetical protein
MHDLSKYLSTAIRTHPYNAIYLAISLMAAMFAGWAASEAHKARVDSAADAERSRKAAEESARAADALVSAQYDTTLSVELNRRTQDSLVLLDFTITNFGQKLARNVAARMHFELQHYETTGKSRPDSRKLPTYVVPIAGDLPPGASVDAHALQLASQPSAASWRLFQNEHYISAGLWAQALSEPGTVLRICTDLTYFTIPETHLAGALLLPDREL